jgi:hypothetical protein
VKGTTVVAAFVPVFLGLWAISLIVGFPWWLVPSSLLTAAVIAAWFVRQIEAQDGN